MLDLNDNLSPIPYRCPYSTCVTNRPAISQTFAARDRNMTYWPKKNRKISLRHLRPIKNVGDLDETGRTTETINLANAR